VVNAATGDHDPYIQSASRRFQQATHPEDGTTLGPNFFLQKLQWIALRNINLLLQKHSDILSNEMRVFFCKYNDPLDLYVKVEKLDIMVSLSNENNVDALLSKLKEYASSPNQVLSLTDNFVDMPPELTSTF
jgi:vesicle coat complex subunit